MYRLVYSRGLERAYKLRRKAAGKAVTERYFGTVISDEAQPRERAKRDVHDAVVYLLRLFLGGGYYFVFKGVDIGGVKSL